MVVQHRGGTVVREAGGVGAMADLSQQPFGAVVPRARWGYYGPPVVGRKRVCAV